MTSPARRIVAKPSSPAQGKSGSELQDANRFRRHLATAGSNEARDPRDARVEECAGDVAGSAGDDFEV
jgi:hypothetical protein